jgi:hypothetical protein
MSHTHYRINEPDVTAESFDGEVIVINLASGRYHSLRGAGTWLWQALATGLDRREAIERLVAAGNDAGDAEQQVSAFIDRLLSEELVVEVAERADLQAADVEPPAVYLAPSIETFTDMESLLLIDPIHEVDVRGWPHTPEPG